jgi:hypothetical protein
MLNAPAKAYLHTYLQKSAKNYQNSMSILQRIFGKFVKEELPKHISPATVQDLYGKGLPSIAPIHGASPKVERALKYVADVEKGWGQTVNGAYYPETRHISVRGGAGEVDASEIARIFGHEMLHGGQLAAVGVARPLGAWARALVPARSLLKIQQKNPSFYEDMRKLRVLGEAYISSDNAKHLAVRNRETASFYKIPGIQELLSVPQSTGKLTQKIKKALLSKDQWGSLTSLPEFVRLSGEGRRSRVHSDTFRHDIERRWVDSWNRGERDGAAYVADFLHSRKKYMDKAQAYQEAQRAIRSATSGNPMNYQESAADGLGELFTQYLENNPEVREKAKHAASRLLKHNTVRAMAKARPVTQSLPY